MSLVKFLNLLVLILILAAFYNLFFGIDSKINFSVLQNENQELLVKNNTLAKENNFLEKDILSKQKNDAHAEKFAREELNLIYEDEDFLRFKEVYPNEPQQ
ncbi:septum formation initiator family protein [Gammaproteobacteria bacterium]|nr:septum formation initiator family protein [Gammaproteobacteria bacterium]MDC1146865.1 septum formation initiator family protein [Gammaproteobacteria bacterium]